MSVGSFVFMLHSHLPYYRKAGMWPFGEESVYECMLETYIPLLNSIGNLWDDGIAAKITLGITPVLAEQLSDEHFKLGFEKYLAGCNTLPDVDISFWSVRNQVKTLASYLDEIIKLNT